MSGWSGIYFRYNIEDRGHYKGTYKGLIGNTYKGFQPYDILVRATLSANSALGCLPNVRYGQVSEKISRTLDVDFVNRTVAFSNQARVWDDDSDSSVSSYFFNDDNYYGGAIIDVTGYVNEHVEIDATHPYGKKHSFKVKYAFVDNTTDPEKVMTARHYFEHFEDNFDVKYYGQELLDEISELLEECDRGMIGELMTPDEFFEYVSPVSVERFLGEGKKDDNQ